jgi:hypothetical protein
VVDCRLGGKDADGWRSHPWLRERTYTGGTRGDIKGADKAKALSNISVRDPQLLVFTLPA